jgi:hypothetical protein
MARSRADEWTSRDTASFSQDHTGYSEAGYTAYPTSGRVEPAHWSHDTSSARDTQWELRKEVHQAQSSVDSDITAGTAR